MYPEKGDVILCQTCEAVYGELKCADFSALSNCGGGVMSIFQFMQSICTQRYISQVQFETWVLLEV